MTTQFFISNLTAVAFTLTDIDNNKFPVIFGGSDFNLKLHYSDTWETQYNLISSSNGETVYFWLNQNGDVSRVQSGIALLEYGNHGDVLGTPNNSIFIYPNNGSLPYAPPQLFPVVPEAVLYYDDY